MIYQNEFKISPKTRGFHLITSEIIENIPSLPKQGLLNLFIQHTSAGITINENADPTVRDDFERSFNQLVKEDEPFYTHVFEGSDDMPAHVKSTLTGHSITIPITNGKLNLGTWQGIYLCEFRNKGGARKIIATIYS